MDSTATLTTFQLVTLLVAFAIIIVAITLLAVYVLIFRKTRTRMKEYSKQKNWTRNIDFNNLKNPLPPAADMTGVLKFKCGVPNIPPPAEIYSPRVCIYKLIDVAKENGFIPLDYQKNIGMLSFTKADVRINIYLTKMTVCTVVPHPKKGTNSLYRRNVSLELLKQIFENPRVHTNKGYR